jgi:hypothetical protein
MGRIGIRAHKAAAHLGPRDTIPSIDETDALVWVGDVGSCCDELTVGKKPERKHSWRRLHWTASERGPDGPVPTSDGLGRHTASAGEAAAHDEVSIRRDGKRAGALVQANTEGTPCSAIPPGDV